MAAVQDVKKTAHVWFKITESLRNEAVQVARSRGETVGEYARQCFIQDLEKRRLERVRLRPHRVVSRVERDVFDMLLEEERKATKIRNQTQPDVKVQN